MRCYNEECDYTLDELGDDAWQTGCALCGDVCWNRSKEVLEEIDRELDEIKLRGLAHELFTVAQLLPEEGIEDGVNRIIQVLKENHLF